MNIEGEKIMGFYDWFFGGNTARPTKEAIEEIKSYCNEPPEEIKGTDTTKFEKLTRRTEQLEKTVENLTKLLDYSNGYSDNPFIMYFGQGPSPSIKFPGGIVRTIKKLEASEEIKDTKPKKPKAKK